MGVLLDYYFDCIAAAGVSGGSGRFACRCGPAGMVFDYGDARLRHVFHRPFAHLPDGASDRVLTVRVCDDRSAGRPRPPLPWNPRGGPPESVERCAGASVEAVYEGLSGAVSLMHLERSEALVWVPDAESLPAYERAAPLRCVVQWWLARNGLQLVHGAAVGRPEGAVLLAGRGGSGKSTTALACIGSDLCYAGDDYVAVDSARVYSMYNTAKMTLRSLELLPFLRDGVENAHELEYEKGIVCLHDRHPDALTPCMPLRAVALPCVSDRPQPAFERIGAARALAALAPSTLFQQRSTSPEAFRQMAGLVRRMPCYRLTVGPDPSAIPACLDALLNDAAAAAGTGGGTQAEDRAACAQV